MAQRDTSTSDLPKSVRQILDEQIETGLHEFRRSNTGLFISSLSAGLEIGFSLMLMATLYSLFQSRADADMLKMIVALGYPLGFIFVIIGRSELFTEHTAMAMLPVLSNLVTWRDLFVLWGLVYSGNLIGGYTFGFLIVEIMPKVGAVGVEAFEDLAGSLIAYDALTILLSAILAGWMMGLLAWLVTSAQETISRIFVVILVTFTIGVAGLHHCIVGSVEVFAGMIISDVISVADYLQFLLWATLGNAIGGAGFVAILKYSHGRRS